MAQVRQGLGCNTETDLTGDPWEADVIKFVDRHGNCLSVNDIVNIVKHFEESWGALSQGNQHLFRNPFTNEVFSDDEIQMIMSIYAPNNVYDLTDYDGPIPDWPTMNSVLNDVFTIQNVLTTSVKTLRNNNTGELTGIKILNFMADQNERRWDFGNLQVMRSEEPTLRVTHKVDGGVVYAFRVYEHDDFTFSEGYMAVPMQLTRRINRDACVTFLMEMFFDHRFGISFPELETILRVLLITPP